ncbi:recombinase family protein [Deinococcus sp. UYEF24]
MRKLDRLSRNLKDLLYLLDHLNAKGAGFVSKYDPKRIDKEKQGGLEIIIPAPPVSAIQFTCSWLAGPSPCRGGPSQSAARP